MTTTTLFGIALAPLYAAIAQVESDRGATSANVYQIDEDGHGYTDDVNRIVRNFCKVNFTLYDANAKLDRAKSEKMMFYYWRHWGLHYQKKTGKPVTLEVLARIHNGGPIGWKKPETVGYWCKVLNVLSRQTSEEVEAWAKGGAK